MTFGVFWRILGDLTGNSGLWSPSGKGGGNPGQGSHLVPATRWISGAALLCLIVSGALSGCASKSTAMLLPQSMEIAVSPSLVTLQAGGGTQGFTATVTDDTQSKGVTWALSGAGCSGAACGTLTNVTPTSVTYNASAALPNPPTVTLTATSVADTTKSAAATITLTPPVGVSVGPTSASV
jgi:hypothetical protein